MVGGEGTGCWVERRRGKRRWRGADVSSGDMRHPIGTWESVGEMVSDGQKSLVGKCANFATLKKAARVYREGKGVLSSQNMRGIRNGLGVSKPRDLYLGALQERAVWSGGGSERRGMRLVIADCM